VLAERDRIPNVNPDQVLEIINRLDDKGRWIEKSRLKTADKSNPYIESDLISCSTFIRNLSLLTAYIKSHN
jgi:hypothetical protein